LSQRKGTDAGPRWAWRLFGAVTDEGVRIVSRRRVEMRVPPSDPLDYEAATVGFWVELRDADDQALYRRVMGDPLKADIEVPQAPGDPSPTRLPAPAGSFNVLVPDLLGADHVSLMRGEPAPTHGIARARPTEVARLPLRGEDAGPSDAGQSTTEEADRK
jgi:hypothetical protein